MFSQYRSRAISMSSTDSESPPDLFNDAFQSSSSSAGVNTSLKNETTRNFNSTHFTSADKIYLTDTDESDLRRVIENDTFLNTVSKNDSLQIPHNRRPSFIIASGNAKGSSANTSIESLQSTIIDGAMDSDASFYSPSETLTYCNNTAKSLLNKRLSSDDEYTDCLSSPESFKQTTTSTNSTNYKSLKLIFSPKSRSENNNTIFKQSNKSTKSPVFENSDSGIASNAASISLTKIPDIPRCLQHLTTILEESTFMSKSNSKRISSSQLMPIIENLRKGPMPQIPETAKFNETIESVVQILNKSSRELTIDEFAQILFYALQADCDLEYLNESESFMSFRDGSQLNGTDSDNTGKELDSIIRQLRMMNTPGKNIESESSPEWPPSLKVMNSKTLENIFSSGKINQKSSSFNAKKEYFPFYPFSNVEGNKENLHSDLWMKNKLCLSPKPYQSSKICTFNISKEKKYRKTPRLIQDEYRKVKENVNMSTRSEDSFLFWESLFNRMEKRYPKILRRSSSLPDIVTEESTTSEVFKIDRKKMHINNRRYYTDKIEEKAKRYRKRRSSSVEHKDNLRFQTNVDNHKNSSIIKSPSFSGNQRKKSSSHKKGKIVICKPTVRFGSPLQNSPVSIKSHQISTSKEASSQKTSSHKRRSTGVDSSHIPAVSQLRRVFSPSIKATERQISKNWITMSHAIGQPSPKIIIPRIEVTRSSPERTVENSPTPIVALRRKRNLQKSNENSSIGHRKPWRP